MEKGTVLVVLKVHVQLLVPYHTTMAMDVHQLEEKCISDGIIHQGHGTSKTGVIPTLRVWIRNIKPRYGHIYDFVGALGKRSLDLFLIGCIQQAHLLYKTLCALKHCGVMTAFQCLAMDAQGGSVRSNCAINGRWTWRMMLIF